MKKLFVIVLVSSFLLSCKSVQHVSKEDQVQEKVLLAEEQFVEANKWELKTYKGQTATSVGFLNKTPIIVINMVKKQVGGNGGCNSFGGEVSIVGNTIHIDKVFSTKMFCDGVPENEYFKMLQQPLQFKFKDDELTLSQDGVELLVFKLLATTLN